MQSLWKNLRFARIAVCQKVLFVKQLIVLETLKSSKIMYISSMI